ncbi:MAG TPA: dihydrodipicolinate synthase family protein [Nitrososphaerales archaeon]|nr:dihydrodipicolinate synthase family protein [Nitrososphaerales archaeon]
MPAKKSLKIGGLFTALITPFDHRGKVASDRLAELVEFQVSNGVDGVYPCGSTGLGPMLSLSERKDVAETVVKSARGKASVVVQVGCADTASAVELAKHAEKAGADAVASLTPYYYKPGDKAMFKHFESVAAAVSIPLLAYNIPQFTGNNLLPATVALMARDGTIQGIKDSSQNLLQLEDLIGAVPEGFVVMNGTEEYGLFAIMAGADGLVSGGASALPELFESMVAAERKGDHRTAIAAQKTVLKVKDLAKPSPIAAYYAILRARGIDCGAPRPPFLPLEKANADRTISGLKELGLL